MFVASYFEWIQDSVFLSDECLSPLEEEADTSEVPCRKKGRPKKKKDAKKKDKEGKPARVKKRKKIVRRTAPLLTVLDLTSRSSPFYRLLRTAM